MDGKRTLRVDEVCKILGISDSLCYELLQHRELEGFRVGLGRTRGGLRILADSLDGFISRRREEFGAECLGLDEIVSTVPADPAQTLPRKKKRDRLRTGSKTSTSRPRETR